jgi:hypothetical protein
MNLRGLSGSDVQAQREAERLAPSRAAGSTSEKPGMFNAHLTCFKRSVDALV